MRWQHLIDAFLIYRRSSWSSAYEISSTLKLLHRRSEHYHSSVSLRVSLFELWISTENRSNRSYRWILTSERLSSLSELRIDRLLFKCSYHWLHRIQSELLFVIAQHTNASTFLFNELMMMRDRSHANEMINTSHLSKVLRILSHYFSSWFTSQS
jgi:hypothetical protein